MSRFVEGEDRRQSALLPSCLEDYVSEDNPARVIDVFVDELDLGELGFLVMGNCPVDVPRTRCRIRWTGRR